MKRRQFLMTSAGLMLGVAALSAKPVKGAKCQVRRLNSKSSLGENIGPLTFDLTAEERWPIRGLDPVLHIGGVAVESYQFANAENTVLRFTCYDASNIADNASMFLQYGDDQSTRTEFPNFRWNAIQ